jgi:hypothetical protein
VVKTVSRRHGVPVQHGQLAQNSLAARIAAEFGADAEKAHAEVAAVAGKRKRSNSTANAFDSDVLRQFVMEHPNRRTVIVPANNDDENDDDDDDDSDDNDQPKKRMAVRAAADDDDDDDIDEDGSEAPELMHADEIPVTRPKQKLRAIKVPRSVAKKIKKMSMQGRVSKQIDMRG